MGESQSEEIIEYPERDGRPIGESDVHIDWIIRIRDMLRHRYQGQRVLAGSAWSTPPPDERFFEKGHEAMVVDRNEIIDQPIIGFFLTWPT